MLMSSSLSRSERAHGLFSILAVQIGGSNVANRRCLHSLLGAWAVPRQISATEGTVPRLGIKLKAKRPNHRFMIGILHSCVLVRDELEDIEMLTLPRYIGCLTA